MRVTIVGAGNVGTSIARELVVSGHDVLLIDKNPAAINRDAVPEAEWLLADACEMSTLEDAGLDTYDVSIAATGDDKANLVHTLLAKTEFGVPRTVGRVNHPKNEWLFDDVWGVDVAVSTPRLMAALVEEAVTVGDLVPLFGFATGRSSLVEMTLPADSPSLGKPLQELSWPDGAVLVAVVRNGDGQAPRPELRLQAGDETLFVITAGVEGALAAVLVGKPAPPEVAPEPQSMPSAPTPESPLERWV